MSAAALLAASLAACSATPVATAPASATATPSPSPTPTPTASPTPEPRYTLSGRIASLGVFDCEEAASLSGDDITIRDGSGSIIALGEVGRRVDTFGWEFELDDVPRSDFYVVEIGDGLAENRYTLEKLEEDDWRVLIGVRCPD